MYRLFPHLCSATPREETLGTESHQSSGGSFRWRLSAALLTVLVLVSVVATRSSQKRLEVEDLRSMARQYENLDAWLFNGETVRGGAATSAGFSKAPSENMHDGNLCGDDEELFEDLCYLKCSLLTEGKNPIRTSAFTCCQSHPCGFDNTMLNMNAPCAGFDVAGKINGQKGACPHTVGTCLEDEELLLGLCYKKCSLLTQGQFTHRVAATTCCSQTGLACLNPMNLRTDFLAFAVGGGKDDGTKSTPSKPHKPLKELTEKLANATATISAQTSQVPSATV